MDTAKDAPSGDRAGPAEPSQGGTDQTGLPWRSEFSGSWKWPISTFSRIHVARPLPGDTGASESGTRVVQNSPLAAMPGVKS